MTKLIKIFKYTSSLVMASLFMMSFNANSSHIKCVDDYAYLTEAFINEADCELGLTGNDTGHGNSVNNGDGMFDITNWVLLEEHVDIDSGISPNNFTIDPTYFDTYNTFMLTFKSATGADPDKYIGYLLNLDFLSFNWFDVMFKKTVGNENDDDESGDFHEISHINLYGFFDDEVVIASCTTSEPCTDIPEPNVIFIFGLGLVGLFIRKRIFK
ncbi:PEP-CTERM sorting domain-containing protein [Thalassotalea psychrophila]|uniref:PEP-CTERM sorting domain-containing protein n=1 Tax=Thalassotalea psychrophila TaxID=3065647 RepID=A0ABY9TSN7_9GAMM|nr:PEP-CTERM sorting domain-containing protein [Colwelliaceae bacterium SQ149]